MKSQLRLAGAVLASASVLLLAACAASPATPAAAVEGAWGTPDTRGEPALEFVPAQDGESGEFFGNDGCNTIGGDYTVSDGTVQFGLMRSTMMLCEDVDTWLEQAHSATVSGDTLTVLNEAGDEIGTLDRAAAAE